MQLRPGGSEGPMYAPHRDLAYLYVPLLKEAFSGLDEVNWAELFKPWIAATQTTEDDLATGVQRFIQAIHDFMIDPKLPSAREALEKTGFFELSPIVQILMYYRLGESVTAGMFFCAREVTQQDRLPPMHVQLAAMMGAANVLSEKLTGKPKAPPELLEQEVAQLRAQLQLVTRSNQKIAAEADNLRIESRKLRRQLEELTPSTDPAPAPAAPVA